MKLRIARATNDLVNIPKMYCEGLGFKILGSFSDHEGFDGVMIGDQTKSYHLEFTLEKAVKAPLSHSAESLLVFYIPDDKEFQSTEARMLDRGFTKVKSHNPYWDIHGSTLADPEGYRVVLCRNDWGSDD